MGFARSKMVEGNSHLSFLILIAAFIVVVVMQHPFAW
jgi:hypothetical protein